MYERKKCLGLLLGILGNVNVWHHNMSIDWNYQIVPEDSIYTFRNCGLP